MAINKAMRLALKALSYPDLDMKKTYKLQRQLEIASHPYLRPLYTMWDHAVSVGEHKVPVRIFPPKKNESRNRILIFFHGGGWVLGNIDSYTAMCSVLAKQTGHIVISVDYRLAPEFPFPAASEDCYAVAREVFDFARSLDVDSEDIALIGDSAGGNLAAVVSLMARDRGDFMPKKQILLYPATASDHGPSSPYPSIVENGTDFLLTTKRINDFISLYIRRAEDLKNPYFAPLEAADLSRQPRTLIITAEYDPLRDEGEAYGEKLRAAGNQVEIHRMQDALHGFIMLPRRFVHVQRCYEFINRFLNA
jgi:acetyl esterase